MTTERKLESEELDQELMRRFIKCKIGNVGTVKEDGLVVTPGEYVRFCQLVANWAESSRFFSGRPVSQEEVLENILKLHDVKEAEALAIRKLWDQRYGRSQVSIGSQAADE